MRFPGLSISLALSLLVLVSGLLVPLSPPFVVKEQVIPPRRWLQHGTPAPDHTITLRIGLPQPNFRVLEQHLYQVSDPDHPRYGHYLSKGEVDELVSPDEESLGSVNAWLYNLGFKETDIERSSSRDWIVLTMPVSKAEKMLNTKYYVWKHSESEEYIIRSTSYSLPSYLSRHIDVVQPTTMFTSTKNHRSTIHSFRPDDTKQKAPAQASKTTSSPTSTAIDPSCSQTITVSCLKQLYNLVDYVPSKKSKSTIGIAGYLEQYASLEDLQTFYADQVPAALNTSFNVLSVDGGINNQTNPGIEANLDTQFAFGLAYPLNGTFYTVGGRPPHKPSLMTPTNTNEPYLVFVDYLLGLDNPPLVVSSSYGEDEQSVPEDYARRVCNQFAQLGARGVSFLVSSGDGGVGDGIADPNQEKENPYCQSKDGKNITRFQPTFPAGCPYVTAVGATIGFNPETAVNTFGSGGGFSNYFKRPDYQHEHVPKYVKALQAQDTYKGIYNPAGRGFPDVSAQGDLFRIFFHNSSGLVGGTSASAPAFSAIVALLNDARLRTSKPSLGFLNPLLYSKGVAGFNDISAGDNPGCGTRGFNATKGWDPVTGLGTPDFAKLKKIIT
ncbi:tripeptidyl peptidase A [Crepidotus variabilis]|uniref:tripeptidyl-peptidase II n=1 Tax=Crepidotus variabilis TaxID=179855 RepID=A0A9P6ESH7_9AGAR|nr:tripeptidyl peptidase A [Crepidotus variabilis]